MTDLEKAVARSKRIAASTKLMYGPRVAKFVQFAGSGSRSWTRAKVLAWIEQMDDDGLSPRLINGHLSALRFASRHYSRRHDCKDFAAGTDICLPARRRPPRRTALTVEQARALVATTHPPATPYDIRDRAILVVMIYAGLRRESVVSIDVRSVRKRTLKNGPAIYFAFTAKQRHADEKTERRAVLQGSAMDAVAAWISWLRAGGVKGGKLFRSISQTMTSDRWAVGMGLSVSSIYKLIRARGEQAGIKGLSPHALRHTFASLAIAQGVEITRLQEELGHKSLQTTLGYVQSINSDPIGSELPDLLKE